MTLQDYLVWFDEVVGPTEPMIRLVDEDHLGWQLTERSFTLGQLIAHIPIAIQFNARVLLQEGGLPSLREIMVSNRRHVSVNADASIRTLGRATGLFKGNLLKLGDEAFQAKTITTPQKGEIPVWRFSAFVLEHHIHHLMELHLSLKVLGEKVHTGTLYVTT
ncbi:MAG: DinB family protein [Ignavibacteria bacterium]|nr:DinB family protein [Ignavibacteria bacterium]